MWSDVVTTLSSLIFTHFKIISERTLKGFVNWRAEWYVCRTRFHMQCCHENDKFQTLNH